MSRSRFEQAAAAALSLAAVAAVAAVHLAVDEPLIDDAYITYRYAANAAEGRGLVYNDGERVMGFTSPGYTLLLASIGALQGSEAIVPASQWINLAALLAAGAGAARLARQLRFRPLVAALLFAMVVTAPRTLFVSVGGMESSLFLAALWWTLWALCGRRWSVAAWLAGAACLLRPEGVFLAGLTLAALLLARRRGETSVRIVPAVLRLSAPGLAWAAFALVYFGTFVPHSIVAKRAGVYPLSLVQSTASVARDLTESFFDPVLPGGASALGAVAMPLAIAVLAVLAGLGAVALVRREPCLGVIPGMALLLALFYATSRTLNLPHYYAHFETLIKLCWWVGWIELFRLLVRRRPAHALAVGLAALLTLAPALTLYPYRSVARGRVAFRDRLFDQGEARLPVYRDLARSLAASLPPGSVVALPEIGLLGYALRDAKVLDTCGLVSPEVLPFLPVPPGLRPDATVGVVPPGLVRERRPDLLILLELFGRRGILADPWFHSHYTPVAKRDGDWLPWSSAWLAVFARNDFAARLRPRAAAVDDRGGARERD